MVTTSVLCQAQRIQCFKKLTSISSLRIRFRPISKLNKSQVAKFMILWGSHTPLNTVPSLRTISWPLFQTLLPLTYTATISEDRQTWYGEAFIPLEYFPPGVDKFNAFAIHGSAPNRQYQQLYPQKPPKTQPDL